MMKPLKFSGIILLLSIALTSAGCASSMPSPKTSHRVIEKYFKGYGSHYKQSDFGQHKVEKVEITDVHELQKGFAEAESYVYLEGGPLYRVLVTLQKKPFGWKAIAWENLGTR